MINQDAHTLDETSKWRLQRHVQKLANAATTSFAERALQKEQIRFLHKVNNEAKVRRSTKSVVLGKAKVMSYEDLEEARAKRAAKDVAKGKGKGRRGRKRKNQAPEANVQEQMALVVDVPEFAAPVADVLKAGAPRAPNKPSRFKPSQAGLDQVKQAKRLDFAWSLFIYQNSASHAI